MLIFNFNHPIPPIFTQISPESASESPITPDVAVYLSEVPGERDVTRMMYVDPVVSGPSHTQSGLDVEWTAHLGVVGSTHQFPENILDLFL